MAPFEMAAILPQPRFGGPAANQSTSEEVRLAIEWWPERVTFANPIRKIAPLCVGREIRNRPAACGFAGLLSFLARSSLQRRRDYSFFRKVERRLHAATQGLCFSSIATADHFDS